MLRIFLRCARTLPWWPLLGWAAAALWFDGPAARSLAAALAALYLALALALLTLPASWRSAHALCAALWILLLGWWLSLKPSNERNWRPEVAQLAAAEVRGSELHLRNVRNFSYRSETDFDPRWEDRVYDLDRLLGVDMFMCTWGSPHIAHTIVSWEFEDAPPLAVSIETRKEVGEEYSAVRGFFRQFELYYVVADERDLIRLRTDFRGEECRLYHLTIPVEAARKILLDYVRSIDGLNGHPRWYNAFTQNCTTTIRLHAKAVGAGNPWDWRILVNGNLDEMGYERGSIDTSLPFAELRARSTITQRSKDAGDAPDYSQRIRAGLPGTDPSLHRARTSQAR